MRSHPHPPHVSMADYTTILGTSTADSLIVSNTSGDDSLALLTGNDTVTGSGGIDIVDLGSGNDLMTQPGDYTAGTILGGSGNDTIHTASSSLVRKLMVEPTTIPSFLSRTQHSALQPFGWPSQRHYQCQLFLDSCFFFHLWRCLNRR